MTRTVGLGRQEKREARRYQNFGSFLPQWRFTVMQRCQKAVRPAGRTMASRGWKSSPTLPSHIKSLEGILTSLARQTAFWPSRWHNTDIGRIPEKSSFTESLSLLLLSTPCFTTLFPTRSQEAEVWFRLEGISPRSPIFHTLSLFCQIDWTGVKGPFHCDATRVSLKDASITVGKWGVFQRVISVRLITNSCVDS